MEGGRAGTHGVILDFKQHVSFPLIIIALILVIVLAKLQTRDNFVLLGPSRRTFLVTCSLKLVPLIRNYDKWRSQNETVACRNHTGVHTRCSMGKQSEQEEMEVEVEGGKEG